MIAAAAPAHPGHTGLTLFAAAAVVVVAAAMVGARYFATRRWFDGARPVPIEAWAGLLAATLSFGAAAIHFGVAGTHWADDALEGLLFAALGWFQLGWGVAYLHRRDVRLAVAAVAVNLGAVAMWAVSRSVGLPWTRTPWTTEPAGTADVVAALLALGIVALLALSFPRDRSASRRAFAAEAVVAHVGAVIGIVALATLVVFAEGDPHAAEPHGPEPAPHVPHESPAATP